MAHQAILRNEFISAENIDPDDILCPRVGCGSSTLVLSGTGQVARIETLDAGQVTSTRLWTIRRERKKKQDAKPAEPDLLAGLQGE